MKHHVFFLGYSSAITYCIQRYRGPTGESLRVMAVKLNPTLVKLTK